MKHVITFCLVLIVSTAGATIKNGYGDSTKLTDARRSLAGLQQAKQTAFVKSRIKFLQDYIEKFELTARTLKRFREIAPDMYAQIDTIRDVKGRPVDVYVRIVSKREFAAGVTGATNVNHDEVDTDAYTSEYGVNTVSVRVAVDGNNSLYILAHEFGHVAYQVPRIATYYHLYHNLYHKQLSFTGFSGHDPKDPSGIVAEEFALKFRRAMNRR